MTIQTITTEYGTSYLKCDCERTAIRIRTQRNGAQVYVEQCLDCGRHIRAVSKTAPEILQMPNRVPFDEKLQEQFRARQLAYARESMAARDAEQAAERERQRVEHTAWYHSYLQTTAWRVKRQKVLERDNYLCQGCRMRQATQAHHLTYDHVGNEFLFELVAICETCHARYHNKAD